MLTGIENYLPMYRDFQERFAPYNEPDRLEDEDFDPMDEVDDEQMKTV